MQEQSVFAEVEARKLVASLPHWHHTFEIAPGITTPGTYAPHFMWEYLNLVDRCKGKRVLDVGASDGFFSKMLRASGAAEVVSVDYRAKETGGFGIMERLSGEAFDYRQMNVYDLNVEELGQFDIILFLGVLYHLPDMLRAIYVIRKLCRGKMFLETLTHEFGIDRPLALYMKAASGGGDPTNFWSPNRACVLDMLHDASFDIAGEQVWPNRILIEADAVYRDESGWKMAMAYTKPI